MYTNRESSLSYPSMVFGSTFINACILESYIADNQSVLVTKSLSILGPFVLYWWVAPLKTMCCKSRVQCNGTVLEFRIKLRWY